MQVGEILAGVGHRADKQTRLGTRKDGLTLGLDQAVARPIYPQSINLLIPNDIAKALVSPGRSKQRIRSPISLVGQCHKVAGFRVRSDRGKVSGYDMGS